MYLLRLFASLGTHTQISCLSKVCASREKQHFLDRREGILRTLTNACEEFRRKETPKSLPCRGAAKADVGSSEHCQDKGLNNTPTRV